MGMILMNLIFGIILLVIAAISRDIDFIILSAIYIATAMILTRLEEVRK